MRRKAYVYLIGCKATDGLAFSKIGISQNVESRLSSLQTGNPYTLWIEAEWPFENRPFAEVVERTLHAIFDIHAARCEWFIIPAKDIRPLVDAILAEMIAGEGDGSTFINRWQDAVVSVGAEA